MRRWWTLFGLIALTSASLDGPSEMVPNDQTIPPLIAADEDASTVASLSGDMEMETTIREEIKSSTNTIETSTLSKLLMTDVPSTESPMSESTTTEILHRDIPPSMAGPSQPSEMNGMDPSTEEPLITSTQSASLLSISLSSILLLLAYLF